MMRKTVVLCICALVVLIICGSVTISLSPAHDTIQTNSAPDAFCIVSADNYIVYQTDGQCSAYAAAYVLRHFGKEVTGDKLYMDIHRTFGFVSPKGVARLFREYGYQAKAYYGDIDTLKKRISEGVPVIAFISIPDDTHYVAVVGYDEQYFYLADSLFGNPGVSKEWYNRKVSTSEFVQIWKTNTLLPDNTYIIVRSAATGDQ